MQLHENIFYQGLPKRAVNKLLRMMYASNYVFNESLYNISLVKYIKL